MHRDPDFCPRTWREFLQGPGSFAQAALELESEGLIAPRPLDDETRDAETKCNKYY